MIGGYLNEDEMTRSMEAELRKTFVGKDFEFGAGRSYALCENKDNLFMHYSSDRVQIIKFTNYNARTYVIECKTKFPDYDK